MEPSLCDRAITIMITYPAWPWDIILLSLTCAFGALATRLYMVIRWRVGIRYQKKREEFNALLERTQNREV